MKKEKGGQSDEQTARLIEICTCHLSSCLKQNTTQWHNDKQCTTGSMLKHPMPNADEHLIINCSTLCTTLYTIGYLILAIGYCNRYIAIRYMLLLIAVLRIAYHLADRLSAIGYRLSAIG